MSVDFSTKARCELMCDPIAAPAAHTLINLSLRPSTAPLEHRIGGVADECVHVVVKVRCEDPFRVVYDVVVLVSCPMSVPCVCFKRVILEDPMVLVRINKVASPSVW
jgi:hypothetical protein